MSSAVGAEAAMARVPARGTPARRSPRLLGASLILAAPGWLTWELTGRRGLASPLGTSVVLALNVAATKLFPGLKLRGVRLLQRYGVNPLIRVLLMLGFLPLGIALLETTGRHSGKPRRTPVGEGRAGDSFWILAEHGSDANYVRNLLANPHVRVRIRRGLRSQWREGMAHVLENDDPYERQRQLCRWHPLRAFNAAVVRVMATDLTTVRIDLECTTAASQHP
jgi:deazaflavin-dependent oxidoreductase (nitroreductase family)